MFFCESWSGMRLLVFSQELLVVLQITAKQLRRIQPIRALGLALSAMLALLDLGHLRLPCGREMTCGRRTPQKQRHAGAIVDFDSGGAWHAIPAATAEFTGQFLPVGVDDRLQFRV